MNPIELWWDVQVGGFVVGAVLAAALLTMCIPIALVFAVKARREREKRMRAVMEGEEP